MTIQEWTAEVTAELKAAGFDVSNHLGFPLVKKPGSHSETVRLLKFRPSRLVVHRRIYTEGCIFVPGGAWRKAEKTIIESPTVTE